LPLPSAYRVEPCVPYPLFSPFCESPVSAASSAFSWPWSHPWSQLQAVFFFFGPFPRDFFVPLSPLSGIAVAISAREWILFVSKRFPRRARVRSCFCRHVFLLSGRFFFYSAFPFLVRCRRRSGFPVGHVKSAVPLSFSVFICVPFFHSALAIPSDRCRRYFSPPFCHEGTAFSLVLDRLPPRSRKIA